MAHGDPEDDHLRGESLVGKKAIRVQLVGSPYTYSRQ
jgi:hypothetical protein